MCKCDLWLNAIISPACPGKAACSEHAAALPCAKDEQILLYRWAPALVVGGVESADYALCVHGVVVKQVALHFSAMSDSIRQLSAWTGVPSGIGVPPAILLLSGGCSPLLSTICVILWCCRHSLEELQQLVDSAVRCIEGTQETIDAAIRRKTEPVSAAAIPAAAVDALHLTQGRGCTCCTIIPLLLVWLGPPKPPLHVGTAELKACWLMLSRVCHACSL